MQSRSGVVERAAVPGPEAEAGVAPDFGVPCAAYCGESRPVRTTGCDPVSLGFTADLRADWGLPVSFPRIPALFSRCRAHTPRV